MVGNKRNFPAALLVPNFETLEHWAREQGIPFASRGDLVREPRVQALYEKTVREVCNDLAQYEKIKKVTLLEREFSLEGGQLTPTLKVKRKVVEEQFKNVIDEMYATPVTE
jgi:long-chain acyl-CoA synthetase